MADAIERWLPVVGWEGFYEVSDVGRIRRVAGSPKCRTARILAQQQTQGGYFTIELKRSDRPRKRHMVARLVAEAWIGPCPKDHQANHKNGDKRDNQPGNLEWSTPGDNLRHAFRTGLKYPTRGERSGKAKLTEEQVREARRLKNVIPSWEIAERFGVKRRTILSIWEGKSWGWFQ